MKTLKLIGILVVIGLVFMFLIPPKYSCRFRVWNPQACAQQEQATQKFNMLTGAQLTSSMPNLLQIDDIAQAITRTSK